MTFSSISEWVGIDFQLHPRERATANARKVTGAEVLGVFGVLPERFVQIAGVPGSERAEERLLCLPQRQSAANVLSTLQLRRRTAIQEASDMINAYSLVVVELWLLNELQAGDALVILDELLYPSDNEEDLMVCHRLDIDDFIKLKLKTVAFSRLIASLPRDQ